jgi:superfamily I DNA/RNA helicase
MDMSINFLSDLNKSQQEAVLATGHCAVLAGPGTGKTKTMSAKAAYLLSSNPDEFVVAVSFSKDSAQELQARIKSQIAPSQYSRLLVGTFHSLGLKQIKIPVDKVISDSIRLQYLRRAKEIAGIKTAIDEELLITMLEKFKIGKSSTKDEDLLGSAYESLLQRHGQVDMQDLVKRATEGMESGEISPIPCTTLLVDEYQDTDPLQYRWIRCHSLQSACTVVGDDDQAIYGWRHSLGYEAFERFISDHNSQKIILSTNYRSHSEIVNTATAVVRNNQFRIEKNLVAAKGDGGCIDFLNCFRPRGEASNIIDWFTSHRSNHATETFAVIARTNRQLNIVESELAGANIPYRLSGKKSIFDMSFATMVKMICGMISSGKVLSTIESVLTFLGFDESDLSGLQSIEYSFDKSLKQLGEAGLGISAAKRWKDLGVRFEDWTSRKNNHQEPLIVMQVCGFLSSHMSAKDKMAIYEAQSVTTALVKVVEREKLSLKSISTFRPKKTNDDPVSGVITLITMHRSKGLEFDRVWVVRCEDSVCPSSKSPLDEERRLFYVAMTRAKKELQVSWTAINPVSPFLIESGLNLKDCKIDFSDREMEESSSL